MVPLIFFITLAEQVKGMFHHGIDPFEALIPDPFGHDRNQFHLDFFAKKKRADPLGRHAQASGNKKMFDSVNGMDKKTDVGKLFSPVEIGIQHILLQHPLGVKK
jgi:hypothetical protein